MIFWCLFRILRFKIMNNKRPFTVPCNLCLHCSKPQPYFIVFLCKENETPPADTASSPSPSSSNSLNEPLRPVSALQFRCCRPCLNHSSVSAYLQDMNVISIRVFELEIRWAISYSACFRYSIRHPLFARWQNRGNTTVFTALFLTRKRYYFFSVVVSPDESDLSSEDRAINLAWSGSKRWLTQTSSSLLTVLQTNQAKHPRPQYSYRKCPRCLPFLMIRSQQPDDHSRSLDDNHLLISIPLAAEILTTTSCSVYQLELRSSKKVIEWDQARARITPTIPYDRRKRRICEGAKEKANIHISLLGPSRVISHSLSGVINAHWNVLRPLEMLK